MMRSVLFVALLQFAMAGTAAAQSPVIPPPLSAEQEQRLSGMSPDAQAYERFRYWAGFQPAEVQRDTLRHYDAYLASRGVPPEDRARLLRTIENEGRRLEAERWNRILTAEKPTFNTNPNAFLVEMVKGRSPGAALDVGMGQGRNAIYLAQHGWNVTGFDPAEKAVELANQTAKRLGVKLTTVVQGSEEFDFGEKRWDLVLLSYVSVRDVADRVVRALKPGGIVVVEGFHRDVTRLRPVGGGVVFDSNELPRLFSSLRVLRYEDVETKTDFGTGVARAVRLCAMKE
jgi:2-polyprenyl-3-methyl-5-hydroxy-6-metoxy-1,4-benzoquinol methylase